MGIQAVQNGYALWLVIRGLPSLAAPSCAKRNVHIQVSGNPVRSFDQVPYLARFCNDTLRHFTRWRHLLRLGNQAQNPRRGKRTRFPYEKMSRKYLTKLMQQMWKWQKKGRIYLAGEIALATALVMGITALPLIRRKWFRLFYYTHHLYILFILFFLFHGGDRHFYMVLPGVFLFALDKLLRVVQSRPETCILSARVYPCKAIELTLPKDPS